MNRARKTAMLAMALVDRAHSTRSAGAEHVDRCLIVSIAAAAHQAWSANVYTLTSDMFPRSVVASVTGRRMSPERDGGVVFQRATGRILQANGNDYTPIFAMCASRTSSPGSSFTWYLDAADTAERRVAAWVDAGGPASIIRYCRRIAFATQTEASQCSP